MRGKRHFTKPFELYHLSEVNCDGVTFDPRPMDKERVMDGENWRIPRICVSTSIDGALSALLDCVTMPYGKRLWVHVPIDIDSLFNSRNVYKPTLKQVPDADVTGEHWLTAPVKMKTIGQVEVIDIDEDASLHYNWLGEDTEIDRFKWRWTIRHI